MLFCMNLSMNNVYKQHATQFVSLFIVDPINMCDFIKFLFWSICDLSICSDAGGTQAPLDGFLENLKEPGRMTGNIFQPEGEPIMQENTLFICAPTNP